ncbi:MAG: Multiple EGF-like-domain protein 3 precursor [bacterium]|nr:Multiple EGF-like-domain protein 3 precursor [bacterium]
MIKLLLVVPLCIAAGCGGSKTTASPDLQAPPDMVVQGCQPPFGRSYIVSTFTMRQAGDGFDLNGDGTPDNQLGTLASFANPTWQDAITKGYAVYLLDVRDLDGPPLVEGGTMKLSFFIGVDADADATNNLGGMGTFFVPPEQFDVNCMTTAGFDNPTVHNGQIQAKKADLDIVAQGVGNLKFVNVILQGTMNADYSVLSGSVGDVGTACALSLAPSGVSASSLLDVIVGTFSLQPDIDLNGDGLDSFGVDANGISSCTTGTGVTIMGHDCACDPRIHDGYSAAMDFITAPAQILGLTAPH